MKITTITPFLIFLAFCFSASLVCGQETTARGSEVPKDIPFGVTSFNRLAIDLKKPEYPKSASDANITGRVELWIEVNEKGIVTNARPVSGPDRLREVSVAAALASKFKPFEFQGKIYKAVGPIAFYFPESKEKEHLDSLKMCLLSEWINSGLFGIPFLTESWVKEVDAIDPTIFNQVAESDVVKNGGQNAGIALIDGVTARLEKRLVGEKVWYFQFGKKVGKLEFVLMMERPEAELRERLTDIKQHAQTLPSDFPTFAASALKSLVGLLDNRQLTIEELRDQVLRKVSDIHEMLGGELPIPVK